MSPASIPPLLDSRGDTQLNKSIQSPPSGKMTSRPSSDATTWRVHPVGEQPGPVDSVPVSASTPSHSQASFLSDNTRHTLEHLSEAAFQRASDPQQWTPSQTTTQDSNVTINQDTVFTPPASQRERAADHDTGHVSSQDSQLLQLSQIAAAQDRMPYAEPSSSTAPSRKRMLNGVVKEHSSTSPARGNHSRNTSTVSVASTTASTIGEVSSSLNHPALFQLSPSQFLVPATIDNPRLTWDPYSYPVTSRRAYHTPW